RRLTLGSYPALSLDLARDAARAALKDIAEGKDPAAERAILSGGPITFEGFAKAYIERHAKRRKKSWRADQAMIENDLLPAWRRRPADTVSRRDVIELLEQVVERGHPTAANRRLALIRKMYAWGKTVDLTSISPTEGISKPAKEGQRTRILSDQEIAALWSAWDKQGWPFGFMFKLLLLTGQRRSDIASMALADIKLASHVWAPPLAAATADGVHELPLSSFALEILASMPRTESAFVFPSRRDRERPVSGFSNATRRSRELSGVTDFQPGDLRRTAAVGMARLGARPEILDGILNIRIRIESGVSGIYKLAAEMEQKRDVVEAWGLQVRAGIAENPTKNP
ncbi:MAG: tyrosine-type recombinase/integrase, partial [Gammaproteobacteria bacterium]|nr:tyrosine-type recombinase/integrase [Gammaproteobacteria bacterium]